MIQLSTLPTKSPENRERPAGPAERRGDFARQLDESRNGDQRSGGKIEPKSGKELPDPLPEQASAARGRAGSIKEKANMVGEGEAEATATAEAEPQLPDDAAKAAAKVLLSTDAAIALLPATLAPPAAAPSVEGAAAEAGDTAQETGDTVLARGGARKAGAVQIPATKKEGSSEQAVLTPVAEGAEQSGAPGKKSGGQETLQDAGLARARAPQEFRIELAKGGKDSNGAEAAVPRGAQASTIMLPVTPVVNAQGADGASVSPGTKQPFDSASVQQPVRPQDFSALVDRLVEARESARTGSVNLSVMHADFGEVSLRFNHDNGNLSVAMASRDPDFARAVNAATPADGSHTGETPFQGGRRDDGTGASSSRADGSANPSAQDERGGRNRAEGRDATEQAEVQANLAGKAGRTARGGIYA